MASCSNKTSEGWTLLCLPIEIQAVVGVLSTMLIISLAWNIFFFVSKCCSGKKTYRSRMKRRGASRRMEDNPIYGNINFEQTSVGLLTEVDPAHSSFGSSSLSGQRRVNSDSQSKTQDCYANLTLKAPTVQSGRSSPKIQYSDVVQIETPPESEQEDDDGNTEDVSNMFDLYASVQTQRTKTIDTADGGEGYANHL